MRMTGHWMRKGLRQRSPGSRRRRRSARRGAVAVAATFLVVLGVFASALILSWNCLVLLNRDMQHKCDIMALAAAPELLDESLLTDAGGAATGAPPDNAANAVRAADQFRQRNNDLGPAALAIAAGDVVVQSGFVADVTRRPPVLETSVQPHNTIAVMCQSLVSAGHPLHGLLAAVQPSQVFTVRTGAYATLDNLVVGFRPSEKAPAPVMPLAIRDAAWDSERTADNNGNGIREMTLRLKSATASPDTQLPAEPNAAVLFYRGTADVRVLPAQAAQGLFLDDLPPDGVLGPATPAVPFGVAGTQVADGGDLFTRELKDAINAVAGQKRAFALYREIVPSGPSGKDTVRIEGFVAAVVLGASVIDNRLIVEIEPCFLIHPTVWTAAPHDALQPARNLFIHKLRLSR